MNFKELYNNISSLKNDDKSIKMSSYMRNQFKFFGIEAKERKNIFKKFIKKNSIDKIDWDFVFECFKCEYRELQYVAIDYLLKQNKHIICDDIYNIKRLVETKSWWDTVDTLNKILYQISLKFPKFDEIMLKWSKDKNIWVRRISIIHQLHKKEKTNKLLLEKIIVNNLNSKEFFINKAIGWSLREYSKTDKKWVKEFIDKYRKNLSSLSIREAKKYYNKIKN